MANQYIIHPAHSLNEAVQQTLSGHRRDWSSRIDAEIAENGVVRLTGCVASYYQKQMAQETLRRIAGIARICNDLKVESTQRQAHAAVEI